MRFKLFTAAHNVSVIVDDDDCAGRVTFPHEKHNSVHRTSTLLASTFGIDVKKKIVMFPVVLLWLSKK